jgi:hypothetical protein
MLKLAPGNAMFTWPDNSQNRDHAKVSTRCERKGCGFQGLRFCAGAVTVYQLDSFGQPFEFSNDSVRLAMSGTYNLLNWLAPISRAFGVRRSARGLKLGELVFHGV